jgi:hypothetical protein
LSQEPPEHLKTRTLPLVELAAGWQCVRFYRLARQHLYFDRGPDGRFNAPDGSFGTLYAARSPYGAFAETLLRQPRGQWLDPATIRSRGVVVYELAAPLRLVHLDGANLARIGATADIPHGRPPYRLSQSWAAAFHSHRDQPDGIWYTARHDPEQECVAIFNRAAGALQPKSQQALFDAPWFWEIANHYEVALAP